MGNSMKLLRTVPRDRRFPGKFPESYILTGSHISSGISGNRYYTWAKRWIGSDRGCADAEDWQERREARMAHEAEMDAYLLSSVYHSAGAGWLLEVMPGRRRVRRSGRTGTTAGELALGGGGTRV